MNKNVHSSHFYSVFLLLFRFTTGKFTHSSSTSIVLAHYLAVSNIILFVYSLRHSSKRIRLLASASPHHAKISPTRLFSSHKKLSRLPRTDLKIIFLFLFRVHAGNKLQNNSKFLSIYIILYIYIYIFIYII